MVNHRGFRLGLLSALLGALLVVSDPAVAQQSIDDEFEAWDPGLDTGSTEDESQVGEHEVDAHQQSDASSEEPGPAAAPKAPEDPQAPTPFPVEASDSDGESAEGSSVSDERETLEGFDETEPGPRRVQIGIGFGSGLGLATGDAEVYGDDVELTPGLAASPLQLYLEVGYRVLDRLQLVVSGQFQTVFLSDGLELVPRARLAARYDLVVKPRWRVAVQAGFGYGYQTHLVRLDDTITTRDGQRVRIEDTDRTKEGPAHVGAGAQFQYRFSERVGLFVDLFVMGMFPQASVHLDANLGVYFEF